MKTDMPDEEREKYEKALRMLGDLRVRANEGNMGFDEGRFLNIFGKAMEILYQIWRTYYPICRNSKLSEKQKAQVSVAKMYIAGGEALVGKDFHP